MILCKELLGSEQIAYARRMKTFLLLLLVVCQSTFAVRIGILDNPCQEAIPRDQLLRYDFGGYCKYEAQNAALAPATAQRVIYFGDSITEFWKGGIPGITNDTLNRGFSGQTTSQMLVRFRSDVINLRPRVLHLMAGTNDIAGNTGPTSLKRLKEAIMTMVEQAQAHKIQVVLGSILPAKRFGWSPTIVPAPIIAHMNGWLKNYAQQRGIIYADYYSAMIDAQGGLSPHLGADEVHPNQAGYAVMRPIAQDAIHRAAP